MSHCGEVRGPGYGSNDRLIKSPRFRQLPKTRNKKGGDSGRPGHVGRRCPVCVNFRCLAGGNGYRGRQKSTFRFAKGGGVGRHPEELSHMKRGESSNPPTSVMHRGTGRDRQVGARALGQRGRRSAAEGLTGEGAEEVPQHPQQREETPREDKFSSATAKKWSKRKIHKAIL